MTPEQLGEVLGRLTIFVLIIYFARRSYLKRKAERNIQQVKGGKD